MAVVKTDLEERLYKALKRIRSYQTAEQLLRTGERQYGVSGEEALAMAYENVLREAQIALTGVRPRKPARPSQPKDIPNG